MSAHRGAVRKAWPRDSHFYGWRPVWVFECQEGCIKYLTDGGFHDAMEKAVSHYQQSAERAA